MNIQDIKKITWRKNERTLVFYIRYKSGLIKARYIMVWKNFNPVSGDHTIQGNYVDVTTEFVFQCPRCFAQHMTTPAVELHKKHWELRMQARLGLLICCACMRSAQKVYEDYYLSGGYINAV